MAASAITSPVEVQGGNTVATSDLPTRGVQKRFDKLTAEKYTLKAEISQLQGDLQRALDLIEKYKQALRRARRVNAE